MNCDFCDGTGERIYRDEKGRSCVTVCTYCNTWRNRRKEVLYNAAHLPIKCGEYELVPNVADYAEEFNSLKNNPKNWLMLSGRPGTGKTTQATLLAHELIDRYLKRVLFFNSFDLFRRLVSSKKRVDEYDRIVDSFLDADVAILDDLLKVVPDRNSFEYADFKTVSLEVLWRRYDSGKPTVITSQVGFTEFMNFDSAFTGRVLEKCEDRFIVKFGENARNWRVGLA